MIKLGIAVAFFVSGFCSLTYQVAWRKALSQTIGVDFYSTALVVAIFLLGLALGAEVGKQCLRRLDRPILGWLTAEAFVSVFGLVSIPAIRVVPELSVMLGTGVGPSGYIADFVANALLLLVPTIAMGVSFPIVTHYFRRLWVPGAVVGVLYSANILGAAGGALGSGLFLVGTLGLTRTVILASLLNTVQLAYILFLAVTKRDLGLAEPRSRNRLGLAPPLPAPPRSAPGHTRMRVLGIAFAIGFVALLFEMVFVRMATMYFSANSYVFPIVVFNYLVLMAFGNGIAAWFLNRGAPPSRLFNGLTIASCLLILLSLTLPHILTRAGFILTEFEFSLSRALDVGAGAMLVRGIMLSFLMMLPVMTISGLFPIFVHTVTRDREQLGANTGSVYFVQTMGNVSGALIGGIVLLPAFGTITMMQLGGTAVIACSVAFMTWRPRAKDSFGSVTRTHGFRYMAGMAICTVTMFSVTTKNFYDHILYYGHPPSRYSEEVEGIAFMYDQNRSTRVNIGVEDATSFYNSDPYPSAIEDTIILYDTIVQKPIERILIIGIGPGTLAIQLGQRYPNARIVIVELLDVVIREMRERGSIALRDVLAMSDVHITDGRRYVARKAIPYGERFDLIQVGVFHVTSSGAGGLFTEEFQRQLRSLLTPEGALSFNAYLPAVKTGFHVFKKGIVYARELGRQVADVLFFNNDGIDIDAELQRYAGVLSYARTTIRNTASIRTFIPDWYMTADDPRYFFTDRTSILNALEGIAPQIDDLPATEYYLSRPTTWNISEQYVVTKKDPRYWERIEGAYALDGSFGSDDIGFTAREEGQVGWGGGIVLEFTEPHHVRGYEILVSPSQSRAHHPRTWTLDGSDDGRSWSRLHEVTGFSDWPGQRGGRVYPKFGRVFWFANPESFRMVRLRVTETVGDKEPLIDSIRLFERSVFGHERLMEAP